MQIHDKQGRMNSSSLVYFSFRSDLRKYHSNVEKIRSIQVKKTITSYNRMT